MNHIEKYCERELQEMKEKCLYMTVQFSTNKGVCLAGWLDIYKIALIEINKELDVRANKKEAAGG